MPPLLCKMIFSVLPDCFHKTCFVTDIVDWDKGFFAYFLCPPSCSLKESSGFAAHRLKMRAKSRYHSEYLFEHITIYAFVCGYVRCPALKGLFAEGLAVETHII